MRSIIIGGLALVSALAVGAEAPQYYTQVQGTVLTGLLERSAFDFTPGSLSDCKHNDVGMLVTYDCVVHGATAKVSGSGGKALTVTFDKVWVSYKRQGNGEWIHEYFFKTQYTEAGRVPLQSEVQLTLWNYELNPSDIKGSLSLTAYGMFGGIQASSAQR